jgi:hypothetical protein
VPRSRRARQVIVATPRFVAARLVPALADAPWLSRFTTSAWVVCNVHFDERPAVSPRAGTPVAWDTVLYDSASLGFVDATFQRGRDHGPTVWTWYQPLVGEAAAARATLQSLDRAGWAEHCLRDLSRAFPDVRARATRVDVCRWGHAMVRPTPGLASSGALAAAARPVRGVDDRPRIHFAHTDLSGMALFEEALWHGARAADDAVAALRGAGR